MHGPRRDSPRLRIAFFDYPDVFEDFYTAYGISIDDFVTSWTGTGNHLFVETLQRTFADVTWYVFSVSNHAVRRTKTHQRLGCGFDVFRSSVLHRFAWRQFYTKRYSWRFHRFFRTFEYSASYTAMLSARFLFTIARRPPDAFFLQDYASGRFDVVILIAKMLGKPVYAYHSGSVPERYIAPSLKRYTLPRADHLIASSESERDMLVSRFKVDPARVSVVLTPVAGHDLRPLPRDIACRRLSLDPMRRYFLFVGRLEDRIKRVGNLIEAFAEISDELDDFDLLVVGDGPDRDRLAAEAKAKAPGRFFMKGWVSSTSEKSVYYNVADCLVLPSVSEGFPTVIAEAMSCGTPVVATAVGGVEELVCNGVTGWLLAEGSVSEIVRAMRCVAAAGGALENFRSAALEASRRRCSPDVVSAQLEHIMKDSAVREKRPQRLRSFDPRDP